MRKEIRLAKVQYGFPESVLSFIRDLVPRDIVGKIRENVFKVNL